MQKRLATLLLMGCVLLSQVRLEAAITAAEYFIDSDPGEGNGTVIEVERAAGAATIQIDVPLSVIEGLASGHHVIGCRVKDERGNWSIAYSRPFCKENLPPAVPSRIVAVEYYFDNDPGPGAGYVVTLANPSGTLNTDVAVPPGRIAALEDGAHSIGVRTRDEAGYWSVAFSRSL